MDRQDDEHAFMRKKLRYGVDYRGAAAFGLWQLAYASKETLNSTNYAGARAAMMSVKNADGRPLGLKPNLLLVPPSLEAEAREIPTGPVHHRRSHQRRSQDQYLAGHCGPAGSAGINLKNRDTSYFSKHER